MSDHYILEDKVPKKVELLEWAEWFENMDNRRVSQTKIGEVKISTVFLGLDHSFGEGPPMIFETMIFGGEHDQYQFRCSTYKEAEAMHTYAVKKVKGAEDGG